jgi:hypothetical protein
LADWLVIQITFSRALPCSSGVIAAGRQEMLFRDLCAKRRGCMPMGLLLMALGIAHQALSPFWVRYFHLTGHLRSLSIDLASGLALGMGAALMVNSFGKDGPEAAECAVDESEPDQPDHPRPNG